MLPDHPTRGPLDAWIKQHTKEQWEEAWRQSEHGGHLQRFLPEVTKHSITIYDDLTPVERSVLAQMRTGKIGLNHYLSMINRADDPLCPCGRAPETTHHLLFHCTRYNNLRQATWTGAEGTPRDLTEALTEKRYVRRAARFMLNTGRLTYLAEATEPAWLEPSAPSSARLLTAPADDG
jgi:tubulin alpha